MKMKKKTKNKLKELLLVVVILLGVYIYNNYIDVKEDVQPRVVDKKSSNYK